MSALIIAAALITKPDSVHAQTVSAQTIANKKIIAAAYQKWHDGTGNFFDLVAEDVKWTITGTSPLSKTYTSKKQFMDEVINPLNKRLSKKIVPTVIGLYADGNVVVALWRGEATATDGKPYNVMYSWHLTMNKGKIVQATAFLDLLEFSDIFKRIKIPGERI